MKKLWCVFDNSGFYTVCVKASTKDDAKAIATTFLNNKYGGTWFEFEDFTTKACDEDEVLSYEDLEV